MSNQINIEEMSIEDKIKMMERLWDDLCHNAESIASPEWHRDVLLVREKSISDGSENILSLDAAKKIIAKNTQ